MVTVVVGPTTTTEYPENASEEEVAADNTDTAEAEAEYGTAGITVVTVLLG